MEPSKEYIINDLLIKRITTVMYQDCEPDTDFIDSLIEEIHARPYTDHVTLNEQQRKYILSFTEEDPLLMAYVEGQNHPSDKIVIDIKNDLLNKIIYDFDSGDRPDLSDCSTTDDWYGHGWDDCRDGFVQYLKNLLVGGKNDLL